MARPLKRARVDDLDFEETLHTRCNDTGSDENDDDDVSEIIYITSDHESNSEQSEDWSDEVSEQPTTLDDNKFLCGKNKLKWSKIEVSASSCARKCNTAIKGPVLKARAQKLGTQADCLSVWQLLFSDDIMNNIICWTNKRLARIRSKFDDKQNKVELKDLDIVELKAFIGCLIYTSVFNSNHENLESLFATDGTGRDIFRATISRERFGILLSHLQFDNPEDREHRRKEKPPAAISEVFEKFIQNCQDCYGVGTAVCIDEMLVSFKGRCPFRVYMPKKPQKYGIKIMCLIDAETKYLYNAYIYCGKDTDGFSEPTQAVMRLAKPLFGTNCNITANSWFSSVELAELLFSKQLTYVGTLKKSEPVIPNEFLPNKRRRVGSTLYGFRENLTMISHVSHKGKATLVISSMHDRIGNDPQNNKPEIISFYNATKGGVHSLDEKCTISKTSHRTRRWPMVIFFRMIDISVVNAYVLHQFYDKNSKLPAKSVVFAKQLAKQLVEEHMKRRLVNTHIPREIRSIIQRFLEIPEEPEQKTDRDVLEKRKTCHLCPRIKKRKTKYLCFDCKKPVCLQCTKPFCIKCIDKR